MHKEFDLKEIILTIRNQGKMIKIMDKDKDF